MDKNPPVVYLGAAIDSSDSSPIDGFLRLASIVTSSISGALVFNPCAAFVNAPLTSGNRAFGFVKSINEMALMNSDVAVFQWSDTPSYGVPLEIEMCFKSEKPFFVIDKSSRGPGLYLKLALSKCVCCTSTDEGLANAIKEWWDHGGFNTVQRRYK